MKKIIVETELLVSEVKEHSLIKERLLKLIDFMPKSQIVDEQDNISNTDWNLPTDTPRPYWGLFEGYAVNHVEEVRKYFGLKHSEISNYWYQQYGKGSYHNWHSHPHNMFSCVYYLSLPSEKNCTTFWLDGKEVAVPVNEGEIMSFPSGLIHTSKPNPHDDLKTVIAFNFDVY